MAAAGPGRLGLRLGSLALLSALASEVPEACRDAASCGAYVENLTARLETLRDEMRGKTLTLQALEEIRTGILSGKRIELPSAQRQHLERGSPLIGEISFDARHRPVSTNLSRHFGHIRTLAPDSRVRLHTFMPLKRSSGSSQKVGPAALLVTVDSGSRLSLHSLDGDVVLDKFDLGHGPGTTITQLVMSPSQDNHFVLTADDRGEIRVHNLKVTAKRDKKDKLERAGRQDRPDGHAEANSSTGPEKRQIVVTANLSATFSIPPSTSGEARKLNTVLPIDRGSQTFFVTGDSLGGIAVFFRNGTMKGRVKVTEDPNGVRGLLRSQSQMVLFYSSHSFGFFSTTQVDVQYPPCTGWNSPLFDVVIDPSFSSSRVVLALSDGDILVFSTQRGKSKACDLTLKFPHVSALPFKLHGFRGHVMGLPTPLEDTERREDYLREVYFFNLAAMDAGYGTAPSRAVALQVSFKPRKPDSLTLLTLYGNSGSSDRSKSQVAIRFADSHGVELYDVSLKTPPPPKAAGGGGASEDSWSSSNWLNWFPKIGVFGIALVGVVIWNVRKATNQRKQDRPDDFDDEYFKERLRERREKRERDKEKAAEPKSGDVGGGLGSLDD